MTPKAMLKIKESTLARATFWKNYLQMHSKAIEKEYLTGT